MTVSTTKARHRAARRPITPLTQIAKSGAASTIGRRTAVVAASSGILVSMLGASPATAAPVDTDTGKLAVDTSNLTAEARTALQSAPTVKVDADLKWDTEVTEVKVTPPPAPEPEPEPAPRVETVSRTTERAATTTTSTETASTAATTETATAAPAAAANSSIISIASRYVGVPYVYGGSTPSGFDCSGFTSYVYAQAGITLPRSSSAQRNVGTVVSRSAAQPGDLIWTPGHVAIYAGGNTMIDAPRPGKTIQFRQIWQSNPTFIRVG
ncbi:cell wall-associated NlpC family hydrolase [Sediminihabitans luteus]|uniref:Cell wall-associated NlpC family hydrolase n=1 Tax=Sediminihabitans luteus TaxID=1138585 RepID=A0A2M9CE38_9CELL|nr:C40 family peptidase [Sediminihabitans luteus]PJJ70147.1 cell wall-associated NlpC family hydrolase [Sediminihabitans luteus]GIJ00552.1 hypothetical protein Slu03_29290 [Sediminihabitans luteus]